jgi:hypothetical protein
MSSQRLWAVLSLTAILGLSNIGWCQNGTISGTITDSTGAVVVGAQVVARDVQTDLTRATASNSQGFYEFLGVKPSTYEVTITASGFEKAVHRDVKVVVGLESHVNVSLTAGSLNETVEVKAEIPLIEPDKTNVSYSIEKTEVQNLPLQGRQFTNLALLTPGVTQQAPGTQAGGLNVSGMRSQSNNWTLDGISNNDPQVDGPINAFRIADAVQEFNVNTSIASTDLGRSSGAQVSVITKSGTNSYHGSGFFFGRNEALDANDWFLNKAGQPKNVLRRQQYGATIGGFLVKDKTFWFLSYEGFHQNFPLPLTATVPNAAARAAVTDPISLKLLQFIPAANISGAAPGTTNWAGTGDQHQRDQTYLLRMDHTLSANNHLMGHYAWVSSNQLTVQQPTTAPFVGAITNLPGSQSAVIEETFNHTSWLNVARIGFLRNVTDFASQDVKFDPSNFFTDSAGNPLPGFVNIANSPLNGGMPRISINSCSTSVSATFKNNPSQDPNFCGNQGAAGAPVATLALGAGTNMPQGRTTDTYQLIDNVSWIHGNHTMQFGGEARREETFRFLNGNFRGAITFTDWQHFAQGRPQSGSLATGGPDQTFRSWSRNEYFMYVQDSWKIKSNFTFKYGIRYELPGEMVEKHDTGSNFVPGIGMMKLNSNLLITVSPTVKGPAALTLTPVQGVFLPRSGQFDNAVKDFAPFAGMAWSPKILPALFGDGKTVIRTGFRLSYDDTFANIPVNMGLNNPPLLTTTLPAQTCLSGTALGCKPTDPQAYQWSTVLNQNRSLFNFDPTLGVNGGNRGIVTFNAWDTTGKTPYAMNYALEIERELGRDYSIGASYIGTQGRRLGVFMDANEPFVTVVNATKRGNQSPNLRSFPFPQYAGTSIGGFGSNSNYNGAVFSVKKRASHGLTLQAAYTFSKSLDENSSFFGSNGETGFFADTRNPRADYGPSAFDVRHQLTLFYLYQLPVGRGRAFLKDANGFLDGVLGGWDVSGITSWHTGFPFTIFGNTAADLSGFNQLADRANLNGPISFDMGNPSHAFTTNNLSAPGAGSIGNTGRNAFYGPSYTNFDLSLQKNFPVTESKRFRLQADFFNLFNHPNFDLPVARLNSAAVGTITSDSNSNQNARLVQLGLRFDW